MPVLSPDEGWALTVHIAALTVELHLPGCTSLKGKRSRLKPLLARLHREFNVSAAEIGSNDSHDTAVVACVAVANDEKYLQRMLSSIPSWIETQRPDLQVVDAAIETY